MRAPVPPIDPQLLATLVAIAETGSFGAAAERVGRTVSAVSMQMKRLETVVGDPPLFKRQGRRMQLTLRGETLLAYARRILSLYAEAQTVLTASSLSTIRLGTPEDYASSLLPKALDQFARSQLRIHVDVICQPSGSLSQLVSEGEIDLAVVTCGADCAKAELLRCEPMVWVTSPSHRVHWDEPVPLALFQPGCTGRTLVLESWSRLARPYRIAYSSPSLTGLLAVVREGLAVSALARCSVPADLMILGGDDGFPDLPALPIGLLRNEGSGSDPIVSALAAEIRERLSAEVDSSPLSPEEPDNKRHGSGKLTLVT